MCMTQQSNQETKTGIQNPNLKQKPIKLEQSPHSDAKRTDTNGYGQTSSQTLVQTVERNSLYIHAPEHTSSTLKPDRRVLPPDDESKVSLFHYSPGISQCF